MDGPVRYCGVGDGVEEIGTTVSIRLRKRLNAMSSKIKQPASAGRMPTLFLPLGKTPARLKWLQTIERNPGAKAPRQWYPPKIWCLNNGLTKWSTYQPGRPVCEEVITDLGRQALTAWQNAKHLATAPQDSSLT